MAAAGLRMTGPRAGISRSGFQAATLRRLATTIARAGRVAVIAVLFGLGSVLQAVEIEEASVAIDEITRAGNALAADSNQVGDGAARISGRFENLDALDGVAAAHGAGDRDRLGKNAAGLVGVIVEARRAVAVPELRDAGEQSFSASGATPGRSLRDQLPGPPRLRRGDDV